MQVVDKRFGKKHCRTEFALFSEWMASDAVDAVQFITVTRWV
jgi:hypothetical protein